METSTRLTRDRFDAVLFDLDGVLTATARIHARCWKRMFDEYLRRRAEERGEPFRPFDDTDYRLYVDGNARVDGVRNFLSSREIELPEGSRDAPPGDESIHGLGNRKNEMLIESIRTEGVEPFAGSVALVHHLRSLGIKTAVVSSSRNCAALLEAAGIDHLFDARVDGETLIQRQLAGKPAPDMFLEAAREIGAEPARSVVVEDAISGVQAGRAGGFGLVIGVSRKGDEKDLAENGADLVVHDLAELLP
jgi:beta-phosphoglucomutase family hydrolase